MNDDDFSDLCDEDFDDGYPSSWPDIRQRLINTRRWLGSMNRMIDDGFEDQELIGFAAQQAVENSLVQDGSLVVQRLRQLQTHEPPHPFGLVE